MNGKVGGSEKSWGPENYHTIVRKISMKNDESKTEGKSKPRAKSWAGCRNSITILVVLIVLNFY